jgi:Protein of unknown function (DUF3891)
MVIGWVQRKLESAGGSAWSLVEGAQRKVQMPCLLVPQPSHAVLAGELANVLMPAAFGELPRVIKQAIQMHDTGWASSDAQQIQRLRGPQGNSLAPVSFVAIPPAEMIEAWTASIDAVEALSKEGALVVSRHFTLLARLDPAHQRFVKTEQARQQRLAGGAPSEADLVRWTNALGFCDLVSLYLLTGLSTDVELPLAHPASPQAASAARVRLSFAGRSLRFTPATLQAGSSLTIQALKHPIPAQGARAETLAWEVE